MQTSRPVISEAEFNILFYKVVELMEAQREFQQGMERIWREHKTTGSMEIGAIYLKFVSVWINFVKKDYFIFIKKTTKKTNWILTIKLWSLNQHFINL